ncbi:MAG TPA: phosphodiester glycosidase family protein [Acidimicrobiales bacterium]|nr:phosphodiester glycosidase family protein [Acidimicrobiales bacterium]
MSATAVVPLAARAADVPVPAGYRVVEREELEPGVEHLTLRRDQPAQNVHIARLAPGMSNRLRPVLSGDVMTGPAAGPETTSSMCARVRCVVAVNGDFAGPGGAVVGGMIVRGELVATFGMPLWQLNFDAAGKATIHDGFDVGVQVTTPDGQSMAVQRVNRPLVGEGVNLYSRRWGPSTLTGADTVEAVLGLATADVLPAGVTPVRTVTLRSGGNSPIGPGQVVLAGRGAGAQALSAFAQRAARGGASLVVRTPAEQSIGAAPHLLSGGRLAFAPDEIGSFMQDRHPRTMVGFTGTGATLLVTVDGRQRASTGMSLGEAAGFMAGLGATDAVNFDGGGSTTFVTRGAVRNVPSDGGERRVVSALAFVAPGDAAPVPAAPPAGPRTTPTDPASLLPDLVNSLLQPLLSQLGGQPPASR